MQLLRAYLRKITYNEKGIAVCWYPDPKELIKVDPAIQWGQPCIRGTRVQTRAIYYYVRKAGDTTEAVADSFRVSVKDVQAAVEWENGMERKVA